MFDLIQTIDYLPPYVFDLILGIEATINHRLGKVRGAMYKAKALMEDFRL